MDEALPREKGDNRPGGHNVKGPEIKVGRSENKSGQKEASGGPKKLKANKNTQFMTKKKKNKFSLLQCLYQEQKTFTFYQSRGSENINRTQFLGNRELLTVKTPKKWVKI